MKRASQSFSAGEVEVLHAILEAVKDDKPFPGGLLRTEEFASLCRKVQAMWKRVQGAV